MYKKRIILSSIILLFLAGCVIVNKNEYINPYTLEEIDSKFTIPSDSLMIQGKYIMKAPPWRDYQFIELDNNNFHWEASFGCVVPADTFHVSGFYYQIKDTLKFEVKDSYVLNGCYDKRENINIDSVLHMTFWPTKELKIRLYDNKICLIDYSSIGLIHKILDESDSSIEELISDMFPENGRMSSTFYSKKNE